MMDEERSPAVREPEETEKAQRIGSVTPMMRQYLETKEQYPDAILFYRLGDFYEMFFEDAQLVSRELELTLTGKSCGLPERAPMCGVPYQSAEGYIARLIEKGYKVAICEQMEDPQEAKGLVRRDVIRVVTPGTVIEASMLPERENHYLLSVCQEGKKLGFAFADLSTGEFYAYERRNDGRTLQEEMSRIGPSEILSNVSLVYEEKGIAAADLGEAAYAYAPCRKILLRHFAAETLEPYGIEGQKAAIRAAGALLDYCEKTQKNALSHITRLQPYDSGRYMLLDENVRRSLELTESIRGRQKRRSLLGVLDRTCTAMGGRLLRAWVEQPLTELSAIRRRLAAVSALHDGEMALSGLREELSAVYDVERLLSRVAYRTVTPKDCLALAASLSHVPAIREYLLSLPQEGLVEELLSDCDPLTEVRELLERAIDPEAPALLAEGRFIRAGYSEELDRYRAASRDGRQWISDLEAKEREETGIKNLRIQYNKVFGYYIEVTKSYYGQVPYRYTRRQTLANSERYTTPELHEIEQTVLGAQENAVRLEQQLFSGIRDVLTEWIPKIQALSGALKTLDALCALADTALFRGYVRPEVAEDDVIEIRGGRHPIVEAAMRGDDMFVPNDTLMDADANRMLIVTGPNMAGKSTYMRQTALIVILAQIGSFVPAEYAHIGIADRIFTRIGSSDDLAGGKSTFMVEMNELAGILRGATSRSLVILDEIGRGTSTFDGLAIAWSVVEYMADPARIGARTLFATHYHELSELEGKLPGVVNYRITAKEQGEDVIFLRRIERGGADKSFGIQVARLAGLPRPVLMRAREILARLQAADVNAVRVSQNIMGGGQENTPRQVNLFETGAVRLAEELRNLDVMAMTPMEAMNTLFELKEKAKRA